MRCWCHVTVPPTQLTIHLAACHFHLALLFSVKGECKIYFSVFVRYTINHGIPPVQNTKIDHAELARCRLSVSCLTNLDYWVVLVDQGDVFIEHAQNFKSFWLVYARLPRRFSLFCFPFHDKAVWQIPAFFNFFVWCTASGTPAAHQVMRPAHAHRSLSHSYQENKMTCLQWMLQGLLISCSNPTHWW